MFNLKTFLRDIRTVAALQVGDEGAIITSGELGIQNDGFLIIDRAGEKTYRVLLQEVEWRGAPQDVVAEALREEEATR